MTETTAAGAGLVRGEERLERTGRWAGIHGLALAATAVAILVGKPVAILAGLSGVGFAAYSRITDAPEPELAVERHVSDTEPAPGETVRVTLTVANESGATLPDLRFADDVPAGLEVVDGTARHTTALRPGKRASIAYEFEAVRGRHEFDSLTVVTRDVSGASRRVARTATDRSTVVCRPAFEDRTVPLGELATQLTGSQPVSATGEGQAFHSLREYRTGDPLGSVDWNRFAKDGELATRRFDQPRTVKVVLLVDARAAAYVTAGDGRPGVDACVHAAGALVGGLAEADCHVGLAALSPRECWLPPASGRSHRERLLDALTTHEAFGWRPPAESEGKTGDADGFDRLLTQLSGDTQVVVCSPFVDDRPVEVARALDARGHDVTVASPDTTAEDSAYRRLAATERRVRLDECRRAGLAVVEWTEGGGRGSSRPRTAADAAAGTESRLATDGGDERWR
ncbi:hypothetical protein C475_10534 [Halosimplex carlsbadense 2-9-1]|uniref:DUF58 domain-containing protein n=1 Tax=Halosimplex carlsbadense 2-9-1 TaxID=797114 RepID=M0CQE5_9EURY|nr:DUF58 domain-containing protein [Halosimplex carlsbadense]ELZ25461.1 hypothetical protein C475_10534 [Halosimplex carlsbadense 2-9-1]